MMETQTGKGKKAELNLKKMPAEHTVGYLANSQINKY